MLKNDLFRDVEEGFLLKMLGIYLEDIVDLSRISLKIVENFPRDVVDLSRRC